MRALVFLCVSSILIAGSACAPVESGERNADAKPFIDPLTLSQSQCGGQPPASTTSALPAQAAKFAFADPFVLPDTVVAHFHFPVSSGEKEAQLWFDTGMAHMANFNHDEAIAAFRKAQTIDPDCALCFWGEGLAFGSNINAPFNANRGAAGLAAALAAQTRIGGASPLEAALINALGTRYSATEDGSVVENAAAFADAMDDVARQFPEDKVILSLAAEANMDTQPWDYWAAGARAPKGRTGRTLALLERAIAIDPDFAPAIHLYIHITEGSVDPFRAERYADSLKDQALGVGHLLHMPSHTYLRLGRWKKSLDANLQAVAADEAYIAASKNADAYGQVYYPHNVHFVVASAHYAGDAKTALEMSGKLAGLVRLDPSAPAPLIEHIAAAQMFTALEFASAEDVLTIAEPPAKHLYLRTAYHYVRGAALANSGDVAGAETEHMQLKALRQAAGFDDYAALYAAPLPGVYNVALGTLAGRIEGAKGNITAAIAHLDAAAEAEASLPYFEPTWWYYPTRQTLAGYLLKDGQHDRAEREFFKTLIQAPNNANALYGLAETFKAKGDRNAEVYARTLFSEAWMGETGGHPDLDNL
ncbi:MAG: tetratricopeptide repeat protein [Pseudomonadota bacterium]